MKLFQKHQNHTKAKQKRRVLGGARDDAENGLDTEMGERKYKGLN